MKKIVQQRRPGVDSRLEIQLSKIDDHIKNLFQIEHEFLLLDGNKKAVLAALTIQAEGKSFAERESKALSSVDWKVFATGHALKEAEYNRDKRRYELLLKAFDAEYQTFKIEHSMIKRQL